MYLSEIKIVDLKHSVVDKENSDPKKGIYAFKRKEYIDYKTKARRPIWFFKWVRYNPNDGLKDVRDYQIKWKYSYVTPDDPFWPEGLSPDVEGHYRYGDVVLMKCPLIEHLRKRELEVDRSKAASMSMRKGFEAQMSAAGAGLHAIDEADIDKMAEQFMPT